MKTMKKVLAIVLALSMIFALSISAQAATIVDHDQDTTVLSLSVPSASSLLYNATTVEGGENYDDVTTYSYYAKFPANISSLSSVSVTATYPADYTLLVDGAIEYNSMFPLDFTTAHVLKLYDDDELIRTFQLAGGIIGATLDPVYMSINIADAVEWVADNDEMDPSSQAAYEAIMDSDYFDDDGEMLPAVIYNLPAGSTAMDVLFYLCYGAGETDVTIWCDEDDISDTGLDFEINGTGDPISYVSGIGTGTDFLSEFSTEFTSGWLYEDENGFPNYGAADYYLIGGESFTWRFVNNFMDYFMMF